MTEPNQPDSSGQSDTNTQSGITEQSPPQFDAIAIGASAGGINAISAVLSGLPGDLAAAIFVVQHVDPSQQSRVATILDNRTALTVKVAEEGDHPEPGVVYVAPANYHLLINSAGNLTLTQSELVSYVRPSISLLFASVAATYEHRLIAIILTGTGSDGAAGMKAIKKRGGVTIVQDPETAEFPGMPTEARNTRTVDYVIPLPNVAGAIKQLMQGETLAIQREPTLSDQELRNLDTTNLEAEEQRALHPDHPKEEANSDPDVPTLNLATDEDQQLEHLLTYLRQSRGFDFMGYKRSSLRRRIRKRMQMVNLSQFGDYLDYLEVHPEEFSLLFNTVLINVTSFFRDLSAWRYLHQAVIPEILEHKSVSSPVRIWSVGCASGEEAYSLAILFAEVLGIEGFRARVKIYATDVDEEALVQARHATYPIQMLQDIPEEWRERYFECGSTHFTFRSDLRRCVIFGRHDLVQDAPISRLDLLVCRNTLMYFNAETQSRILARFHFALNPRGTLFLGKAEMLLTHTNLFSPINLPHRIFVKVPKPNLRNQLLVMSPSAEEGTGGSYPRQVRLRELSFNAIAIAQIVLDAEYHLILANTAARQTLGLRLQDLGRPFKDLELSYRPIEMRSYLDRLSQERQTITIPEVVRYLPNNEEQYIEVQLSPLEENSQIIGISITFTDVTRYHNLQMELQRSNQELETINEELQSSNEELETANEELQSTNEELETTNEELQSANEEMETMNEELQSTNEELQTINDELRVRTDDLNRINAFLNSILTSLKGGVVVVDQHFDVLKWNQAATNLWGLRADEVEGQSFLSLDIGLPVGELREPIRRCLAQDGECSDVTLQAVNRLGRAVRCRISFNPLVDSDQRRHGVILLMETEVVEE